MRRLLMILFCCLPLLTSCWDRVEMQNLAIITATAIDKLDDGQIRISVQIFIPRTISSGETGDDPSSSSTFIREGIGKNLGEAISLLQVNIPRRLFWGHCKVYIFGENLAKSGIRKELDYLERFPGSRGGAYLFVNEGEGRESLTLVPVLERHSAEVLKEFVQEEIGLTATLRDVDKGLMGKGRSVSIPYIKKLVSKESARQPHETISIINGAAIFRNDKMVGLLDINETKYLLLLKGDVTKGVISVSPQGEEGEITIKAVSGKIKFKPKINNDRWIMNVKFSIKGNIVQNETRINLLDEKIIKKLEKEYEKVLEKEFKNIISKLQQEWRADVLDFGSRFYEKYPQEWKKLKGQWDKKYPEVELEIDSDVNILGPGYIGPPGSLPQDEVRK